MEQRVSIITLGVDDLSAMREFYEHILGWHPVASNQDIVFYKLHGMLLSLFGRKQLAEFIGLPSPAQSSGSFTLACNVHSSQAVMDLYNSLKDKGVKIIKEPLTPFFGGLLFYFSDPEGNIWEVAYNPLIPLDERGEVITHESIDHL